MSNAVKHANATEICVKVALEDSALRVEVLDDGRGLGPGGDPTGNGLTNMRERMAAVGGRINIEPREGGGTRVVMVAPLGARPVHVDALSPPSGT